MKKFVNAEEGAIIYGISKSRTVIEDSGVREEIDRALIRQFDLLPVARKMVMEELANGQQN